MEGAAVCGGGFGEQKAPRVLLLLLLKERVKREKEIEDERERERLLALLALLQRMMSWSMTSPCSVITAPLSSSSSDSLLPCIPLFLFLSPHTLTDKVLLHSSVQEC